LPGILAGNNKDDWRADTQLTRSLVPRPEFSADAQVGNSHEQPGVSVRNLQSDRAVVDQIGDNNEDFIAIVIAGKL